MKRIILLLCIFLLFSGCLGKKTQTGIDFNPYQGTEGITQSFLENSPPDEVKFLSHDKENEVEIGVLIRLENSGAYSIGDGVLVLGYEKDFLEPTQETTQRFQLKGKTRTDQYGESDIKEFGFYVKNLESEKETHTTTLISTVCYDYLTNFTDTMCIDIEGFLNPKTKNLPCTMRAKNYPGQGAPVVVTKVEPELAAAGTRDLLKPEYTIYVENRGKGQPLASGSVDKACSSAGMNKEDFNLVTVKAFLGERPLNCRPKKEGSEGQEGYVWLNKEQNFVKCVLEEGVDIQKGTFASPLKVELHYGYTESTSKNILIRKELI